MAKVTLLNNYYSIETGLILASESPHDLPDTIIDKLPASAIIGEGTPSEEKPETPASQSAVTGGDSAGLNL